MRLALSSKRIFLAIVVMVSVAVYRPLVLWSHNPWDLAAPHELFLFSVTVLFIQVSIFLLLVSFRMSHLASAVFVGGSAFVLLYWRRTPAISPWVWLGLLAVTTAVLQRVGRARWLGVTAAVTVAVLMIAPASQVAIALAERAAEYPITELTPRQPANATGMVEDVLVVVVDSYPSPRIARDWFDHQPKSLLSRFRAEGLTTPDTGWSHHTFTHLAISSLMELRPIVEPGISNTWGNRRSSYELVRGDNLVASTLQSAGFRYTHIESGWDGGHCGHKVDDCVIAPWFRETTWLLLSPSVFAPLLLSKYGNTSVPGTKNSISSLIDLEERFDDGRKDYVFAHLLLPHAPVVVDEDCQVEADLTKEAGVLDPKKLAPASRQALGRQMACVDALLSRAIEVVGDRTAVLITGDHGPGSNGQMFVPPDEWSDADIAERLGVLLAYKVPDDCRQPETDSNLEAMRLIMTCTVDINLPSYNGMYVLGSSSPVFVEPSRMDRIKDLVASGDIQAASE